MLKLNVIVFSGCMGKLFSNQSGGEGANAIGNLKEGCSGLGGCRSGGCCRGHGGFNIGHGGGEPCMGKCNPRKMYADTYSYLNNNLMQPVVNEVYNDLKNLTPENTVMNNNAMAAKMGMSPHNMNGGNSMEGRNAMNGGYLMQRPSSLGGNSMQGGYPIEDGIGTQEINYMQEGNTMHRGNAMQGGYFMERGNPKVTNEIQGTGLGNQMANQKVQQMMGGMGPNILEMMKSGSESKPISSPPQGGQMPGQMIIDAPQSPHGQVGVTPLNATGGMCYDAEMGISKNPYQHLAIPATQYVSGSCMHSGGLNPNEQNYCEMNASIPLGQVSPNMQQEIRNPNMQKGQIYSNPSAQQIAQPSNRNYGMHNQGMKKFNEMFPGVMGSDLGFDPMAVAMQMNPENHKRSAIDAMQKMMSGNQGHMKKELAGANAGTSNIVPQSLVPSNQENITHANQQAMYGQPGQPIAAQLGQNQQYGIGINGQGVPHQQVYYETNGQQLAYTGAPAKSQGQLSAQQQYRFQQQQQEADPNKLTMHASLQQTSSGAEDPNVLGQQAADPTYEPQQMIQDPIFPADTSKPFIAPLAMRCQKFYQYNTLGQPVDVYPAKMFHSAPETNLRQTLYPQPPSGKLRKDVSKLNIKSTVSKTSIMGYKPAGRTHSKSQLQNIYNQYKGSQSNTHQHIRNPVAQSNTYSEGKLGGVQRTYVTPANPAPLERVGGDTTANNQPAYQPADKEVIQEHGDVLQVNKPHGVRAQEIKVNNTFYNFTTYTSTYIAILCVRNNFNFL